MLAKSNSPSPGYDASLTYKAYMLYEGLCPELHECDYRFNLPNGSWRQVSRRDAMDYLSSVLAYYEASRRISVGLE